MNMVCYHPLKAFPVGVTKNNKTQYKITSYDINHVEILNNNKIVNALDKNVSPYSRKAVFDFLEIPCGQCLGCRLDYASQWADRCVIEMMYHDISYFVTLTYDDEHLPHAIDYETGQVFDYGTLKKRDLQLFMKRLRRAYAKKYDNKLRFIASGEYGSKYGRPHFHLIIFGLKLDDLQFFRTSDAGFSYFKSKFLKDIWNNNGEVIVAEANWNTAAYTCKYILKKQKGAAKHVYTDLCVEPEFSVMSRRPGLARQFFDEKGLSLYDFDEFYVPTPDGAHAIRPPRYFDKLAVLMDEDMMFERSQLNIESAEVIKQHKLDLTDNDYLSMLQSSEDIKLAMLRSKSHSL